MTREEAAQILDGLHERLDIEDGKDWRVAVDALLLASAVLHGVQPDPETGLVPCGCGGKAEYCGSAGDNDWVSVGCCLCDTDTASYATKEEARTAWYRAMGYGEAK